MKVLPAFSLAVSREDERALETSLLNTFITFQKLEGQRLALDSVIEFDKP